MVVEVDLLGFVVEVDKAKEEMLVYLGGTIIEGEPTVVYTDPVRRDGVAAADGGRGV